MPGINLFINIRRAKKFRIDLSECYSLEQKSNSTATAATAAAASEPLWISRCSARHLVERHFMTIKCNYDTRAHRINGKWKWILGAIIVQPLWSFNARYLLARLAHTINYRVFFFPEMKIGHNVVLCDSASALKMHYTTAHSAHTIATYHHQVTCTSECNLLMPGSWWLWCWCLTAVSISISIIFASDCNSNKYTYTT